MGPIVAALGTPGARFEMSFDEGDISKDAGGMLRVVDPGATNFDRLPPLPVQLMTVQEQGHDGAVLCGVADEALRQGSTIILRGNFDAGSEAGVEAERLVRDGVLTTWSPTFGDETTDLEITSVDAEGFPESAILHFVSCSLLAGTLTPIQAFSSAKVRLVDAMPLVGERGPEMVPVPNNGYTVNGNATTSAGNIKGGLVTSTLIYNGDSEPGLVVPLKKEPCKTCSPDALAAAAAPVHPPLEWFDEPDFDEMTPIIVTEEGQVFGLLAGADCHIGIQTKCVTVAQTSRDFGWFNHGLLKTSEGKDVAVGQLTLAGGHAGLELDARSAAAHYDDTRSAVADVQVGWNEKFNVPWFAGALKPGVSEEDVRTLRASGVSGDWRNIRGELQLVAALVVPVPGFPIYRSRVASGEPEALIVASGALSMAPIDILRREIASLRVRLAAVENVTKPLVASAAEKLLASLATPKL
jgi:hypothetical protein